MKKRDSMEIAILTGISTVIISEAIDMLVFRSPISITITDVVKNFVLGFAASHLVRWLSKVKL